MVAATKLPTVTDVPLHFKAVSVTHQPDEKSDVSAANGILYQMSGSTEVSLGGKTKMLNAGEGLFIAGGETAVLTAFDATTAKMIEPWNKNHISVGRTIGWRPQRKIASR